MVAFWTVLWFDSLLKNGHKNRKTTPSELIKYVFLEKKDTKKETPEKMACERVFRRIFANSCKTLGQKALKTRQKRNFSRFWTLFEQRFGARSVKSTRKHNRAPISTSNSDSPVSLCQENVYSQLEGSCFMVFMAVFRKVVKSQNNQKSCENGPVSEFLQLPLDQLFTDRLVY